MIINKGVKLMNIIDKVYKILEEIEFNLENEQVLEMIQKSKNVKEK